MNHHCAWVFVILGTLLFVGRPFACISPVAAVTCVKPKGSLCVIKTLPTDDGDVVQFPDLAKRTELRVMEGNLVKLTETMIPQLPVRILRLEALGLNSVFVGPNFEELHLRDNKLTTIETPTITESTVSSFALKVLDVRGNLLTDGSPLASFTKLEELYLDDNRITTLSMDLFTNMRDLRVLSAVGNGMVTLVPPANTLTLAELQTLSLNRNQLSRLDMTNWQIPSLQTLQLTNNTLVELEGLDGFEQLLDLRRIGLAGNNWSCGWLQRALGNAPALSELTVDADVKCSIEKVAGICCRFATAGIESDTDAGKLFLPQIGQVREAIAQLDRRHAAYVRVQNDKLTELSTKLQQQVDRLVKFLDNRENESDRTKKQAERMVEHVAKLEQRTAQLTKDTNKASDVERERKKLLHYMVDMKNKLILQAIETDRVWAQANAEKVDLELRQPAMQAQSMA